MFKRFVRFLLVIVFLLANLPGKGHAAARLQTDNPQDRARALLETLTPEERVGQLFLVTFQGPSAIPTSLRNDPSSQIYDLISIHHIGGVVLLASNDNFIGPDLTLTSAISLTRQLQRNEYDASQTTQPDAITGDPYTPVFIPLFIGISQEGDGYTYDQILNSLTPLPSQMAIGATWQPEIAKEVGTVLGDELSALGINLLIGPSLDVLEPPFSESGGDLGVRTFGGDPFWVGEMGKALITGVHQGSSGQIAVIPKHFPGFGGSDRLPEEEVATVRKSLEGLKQVELAPFFAVTGNAPSSEATADGLLTSHLRIQGFQGNIRDTTKPISFDGTAFAQLMGLNQLSSWRTNGGVMVSADLGSRAVRRFYDPTGQTFNSKQVARDAFLAGNDLLFVGNFTASGDADSYTSIINTLDTFTRKYREDVAFAQRVDEAVLRILTLKFRLYNNNFSVENVLPSREDIPNLGQSGSVTFEAALQAATLISPSPSELSEALPVPPGLNDNILFVSDARIIQQCSKCSQQFALAEDALQQTVTRLYGSDAAGLVRTSNLLSYSFQELQDMLNSGSGITQLESDLRKANWIVFAMLDTNPNVGSSQAMRRFLTERPDLIQKKKIVAFAFNAPYFLDATDISKLTAYYGLYSRAPQFVDVAARLLFQEVRTTGSLPVSVPGVGYDLNVATFPDPNQTIRLILDLPQAEATPEADTTPTPSVTPQYQIGQTIPVRTGVILDYNGHSVPDGTVVLFVLTRSGDTALIQQPVSAQTIQGIARATMRLDFSGLLEIRAESNDAKNSEVLQFDVPPPGVVPTTEATSTPTPTATPTNTPTPTPTPTATATPTATTTPSPTNTPMPTATSVATLPPPTSRNHTYFGEWLLALFVASAACVGNYWLGMRTGQVRWAVRGGLLALIGGLAAYSYLAVGLPGSATLIHRTSGWGVMLITLLGAVIGAAGAWVWNEIPATK